MEIGILDILASGSLKVKVSQGWLHLLGILFKVDDTPNGRSPRKRLIFAALCNNLIDYFIVCFEHQCNTMRAVQKVA